jgi:hypothetical protein
MSWLDRITPINLQEEKAKFFADFSYNPQFIYEKPLTEAELHKHGLPIKKYADLAQEILDKTFFGRNEKDLLMMEGPIISQNEVTKKCQEFLEMHKIEKKYDVVWSSSFVPRATMSDTKLKLRTGSIFHKEGLIGLIYHEIGTHALRRFNYEQQAWFRKKKQFGIRNEYLRTEEGLATLHALLPHSFKSAYTSAIRYAAIIYAREHAFADLWNFLGKYIQDPETRWMVTFRQKRGLTDTSVGGGSTKDLVYLEGIVDVWLWLAQSNFDIRQLYWGKIACEDSRIAVDLDPDFQPLLPSFFTLNPEKYAQDMQKIGEANFLK